MRYLLLFLLNFGLLAGSEGACSGVLENGLSYYVCRNKTPEKQAFVKLLVKTGSAYEMAGELGYAHLVEHMVYRGSDSFADGEVLRYFDSLGAWNDPDTNGSTSFDTTEYHFSIPLDRVDALDKTLFILSEFAGFATFKDEVVEKEKGVVIDEMHRWLSNVEERGSYEVISRLMPQTTLAKRHPMGTEESIQGATGAGLRRFYEKWYSPHRMAVVVVGDLDVEGCIATIHEVFGRIPRQTIEMQPELNFECGNEVQSLIYVNPQLSDVTLGIVTLAKEERCRSVEDFLMGDLVELFFLTKLSEMEEHNNAFGSIELINEKIGFNVVIRGIEAEVIKSPKQAAQIIARNVRKWCRSGITKKDLSLIKIVLEIMRDEELDSPEEMDHEEYADKLCEHFLHGKPVLSKKEELEAFLKLVQSVALEDLNANVKAFFTGPLQVYVSTDQQPSDLSEEELLEIFEGVDSSGVEIAAHDQHNNFAVTTWTLNNGITVSLRPSNIEKKQVTISALAAGGISSLTGPEECTTAKILIPYIKNSGIGTFSPSALQKYDLDFNVSLEMQKRTVVASGGKDELETLFEIIHAFFSSPSLNENIWDDLLEKCSSNEMQRLKDPEVLFARHLTRLYSQDCMHLDDFDAQFAKEKLCRPLFDRFFGAPKAFHFAITGDFTMEEVTPLIKNYLGTLRSGSAEVGSGVEVIKTPAALVDSKLHVGSSTNIKTVIGFVYPAKEILCNVKNQCASDLLCLILHRRLKNTLREDLGQTYHVDVERFGPKDMLSWNTVLQVHFTGQEAHRESMINESLRTIENMKHDGVTEEELTFAKQALSQEYKRQHRSNYYWSYTLNIAHLFSFPYDTLFDYEKNLSSIQCDNIHEMIGKMFNGSPPIVTSLLPEKNK